MNRELCDLRSEAQAVLRAGFPHLPSNVFAPGHGRQ